MSTITRMWLGFSGLCAGIIHLALIGSSPVPVAALLGVIGTAEVVWGLATFIRTRIPFPRIALFGSLTPVLLWGALVAAAAVSHNPGVASFLGFDAMALAAVFGLFIAITLAVAVRRATDFSQPTRATSAPRYVAGVLVGGIVAAILVTPALSATDAGKYAPIEAMPGMYMGPSTSLVIHTNH
jgi:hypothetical protein